MERWGLDTLGRFRDEVNDDRGALVHDAQLDECWGGLDSSDRQTAVLEVLRDYLGQISEKSAIPPEEIEISRRTVAEMNSGESCATTKDEWRIDLGERSEDARLQLVEATSWPR